MSEGFYDALVAEFPWLAQALKERSSLLRAFEWAFNQGHARGREDGQADLDAAKAAGGGGE